MSYLVNLSVNVPAMINNGQRIDELGYIYRLVCHEQERKLCSMEIRQLLQQTPHWNNSSAAVLSDIKISVQRSPYMKYRLDVWLRAESVEQLLEKAAKLEIVDSYKAVALESREEGRLEKLPHAMRRELEQALGGAIGGRIELADPKLLLGILQWNGEWLLGRYEQHGAAWQRHDSKPRQYSTALGTRAARAIVNIAVPQLDQETTLLDPCCGIGTVLLEAASQGIAVRGYDLNPLAVVGARENIAAFSYNCTVSIADMRNISDACDVAVLDLPYNHCSVLPASERIEMLLALKRLCKRAVIVSVEPIRQELEQIGAKIVDVGHIAKTHFKRDVWLVTFGQ